MGELREAERLSLVPFPFPYAQMISVFLMLHCILLPIIAGVMLRSEVLAFTVTWITIFALTSINYIAAELEMPYGDDVNDINMGEFMVSFNLLMRRLMTQRSRIPPTFIYNERIHEGLPLSKRRLSHLCQDVQYLNAFSERASTFSSASLVGMADLDDEPYVSLFSSEGSQGSA